MKDMTIPATRDRTTKAATLAGNELVSVIMSNYCGARWLQQAIRSVLDQTYRRLELIVVDDASTDDSVAIIRAAMADDPRVRLIECPTNLGPSGARNLALDKTNGSWVAIMDSDDLMHPARIARLLGAARHLDCNVVADDMIFFGELPAARGRTLLQSLRLTAPQTLSLVDFIRSDNGGSGLPPYGYLKPMIHRKVLNERRYDPTLRVGEDFDFYARLLLGGARFSLLPDTMYLYRRHSASLSHRLSTDVLVPLLKAHASLELAMPGGDPTIAAALRNRRDALTWALHYSQLVTALKARDIAGLLRLLSRHPRLVKPIWQSLQERRQRDSVAVTIAARTPFALVLAPADVNLPSAIRDGIAAGARWVTVPPESDPGSTIAAPLAPLAAELSELSSRYLLDVFAVGPEGRHAAGMLPPVARLRFWPEVSLAPNGPISAV